MHCQLTSRLASILHTQEHGPCILWPVEDSPYTQQMRPHPLPVSSAGMLRWQQYYMKQYFRANHLPGRFKRDLRNEILDYRKSLLSHSGSQPVDHLNTLSALRSADRVQICGE